MREFGAVRSDTPAFITGSRAYGTPRPDSDLDLVVYLPESLEANLLFDMSDDSDGVEVPDLNNMEETVTRLLEVIPDEYGDTHTVRFGKLNLVVLRTRTEYDIWRMVKDRLVAKRRKKGIATSREDAVKLLQSLGIGGS